MKKIISVLCSIILSLTMFTSIVPATLFATNRDVEINEINFPDAEFRSYVSENYDKDKDGILTTIESDKVIWGLNVSNRTTLTSLTGIEYFTKLKTLYCSKTGITELDISKNTALTELYCDDTEITALDVSKNTELTKLYCSSTKITELDVSKNTALTYLSCPSTKITKLDVSKNTALTYLSCPSTKITKLDVSKNTALTYLSCSHTVITELDVSKNTALTYLSCSDTVITELDVSKNTELTTLYCYNAHLSKLILPDEVKNNLIAFYFSGQTITAYTQKKNDDKYFIDMSEIVGNDNLSKVKIDDNDYYTYDEATGILTFKTNNPKDFYYFFDTGVKDAVMDIMVTIGIEINDANFPDTEFKKYVKNTFDKDNSGILSIAELDAVTEIGVGFNSALKDLTGIEHFTKLQELRCPNTGVTALDVSKNTALTTVSCYDTGITALDVSKNIALTELNCSNTKITELDISKNTELTRLHCSNAHLSKLILPDEVKTNLSTSDFVDFSKQTITILTEKNDKNQYTINMNDIVGTDVDKVSITDTSEYTYDETTGIVTIVKSLPTSFKYNFDTGVKSKSNPETTVQMDVTAILDSSADYTKVDKLIADFNKLVSTDYENYSVIKNNFDTIVNGINRNLLLTDQTKVNNYLNILQKEINKLVPILANYTEVDKLITDFNKLVPTDYENYSVIKNNFDTIVNEINRNLLLSEQTTVDNYKNALQSEINKLVPILANYTKVDKLITDFNKLLSTNYQNYTAIKSNFDIIVNGINRNLLLSEQTTVDNYKNALQSEINKLVPILANYTEVDKLITDFNKLVPTDYENYSVIKNNFDTIVNGINRNLLLSEQTTVDNYKNALQSEINKLVPILANYTKVDKLITDFNKLVSTNYQNYTAIKSSFDIIVNGINRNLLLSEQTTVDNYENALQLEINKLVPVLASYTEIDKKIIEFLSLKSTDYTNYDEVKTEVVKIYANIDRNLNNPSQTTVDNYVKALKAEMDKLVPTLADYTKVDEEITNFNKLIPTDYENYTAIKGSIDTIISGVNRNLLKAEQTKVDSYEQSIKTETNKLVPLLADYTKVDEEIIKFNKLLPTDYENYTAIKSSIDNISKKIDRKLLKSQQSIVDEYIKAIQEEIEKLVPTPADYIGVDEKIINFLTLDSNNYTNYKDVKTQIIKTYRNINKKLKNPQQATVDGYIKTLQEEVDKLIYKPIIDSGTTITPSPETTNNQNNMLYVIVVGVLMLTGGILIYKTIKKTKFNK